MINNYCHKITNKVAEYDSFMGLWYVTGEENNPLTTYDLTPEKGWKEILHKKVKSYFAKYLPKPGGFRRTVKDANSIPYSYEEEIQLFLCNSDIKAGDKVQFQLAPGKSPWKELEVLEVYKTEDEHTAVLKLDEESSIHTTPDQWCFKVIGPIPPEAKWVKEGDEFEEDEIELIDFKFIWSDKQCCSDCKNTTWCVRKGCAKKPISYKIKGPCGHFH